MYLRWQIKESVGSLVPGSHAQLYDPGMFVQVPLKQGLIIAEHSSMSGEDVILEFVVY